MAWEEAGRLQGEKCLWQSKTAFFCRFQLVLVGPAFPPRSPGGLNSVGLQDLCYRAITALWIFSYPESLSRESLLQTCPLGCVGGAAGALPSSVEQFSEGPPPSGLWGAGQQMLST